MSRIQFTYRTLSCALACRRHTFKPRLIWKEADMDKISQEDSNTFESMPEHGHWSTYDMSLEGALFNHLHRIVSTMPFQDSATDEILERLKLFSQSKGWGEEDSFYNDLGQFDPVDDSEYNAALRQSYLEDPDAQYTHEVNTSVQLLLDASVTQEARAFVGSLACIIEDARSTGRQMCRDTQEAKSSIPASGLMP